MTDISLRVKLASVSLLEHNLNQQISHLVVLTLHVKFALTKILVRIRLNLTQPYQTSGSWAFFICAISLKVYLSTCV